MKRTLLNIIGCVALVIAPQALAVRDKAAPAKEAVKEEPAVPSVVPAYVLKHRSSFHKPSDSVRVPFWPVGWSKQKQAMVAAAVESKFTLDPKSFVVTFISIPGGKDPSLARINDHTYEEGQILRMPKGSSPTVQIRVGRITDGMVVLEYGDQKIQVPQRREKLNQRKADEEMLKPE